MIGDWVGVEIPDSAIFPDQDLKPMRDSITEIWRERFIADMRKNISVIANDPEI